MRTGRNPRKLGKNDYVRITRPVGTNCGSENPNHTNGWILKVCKDGTARVKVRGHKTEKNWESLKWLTRL